MKKIALLIALFLIITSCKNLESPSLKEGIWLGEIKLMDNQTLPFNFKISKSAQGDYIMESFNAEEVLFIDEITTNNDSIMIKMPAFEGYIYGVFSESEIIGDFIQESMDRSVSFKATYGIEKRFDVKVSPELNVSGVWESEFSPNTTDSYMGKGVFTQTGEDRVVGTFRTTTGDYRFLEGVMDGDSLKLSTFDGAHVFLFMAKVTDSTLNGTFYSGNHFKEPFVAKRNATYELPDEDSLTFIKEGYEKLSFSFADSKGNMVSLEDELFKDKVVIVQIMGTWCPNCLDETKYLVNFLKEQRNEDLEIVALSFEYAKTEEAAFKAINRLKERIGISYPVLLAQYGSSDKDLAQEKLPMLNHILSYPTTIFLDKTGAVRKISTGFNGPATGEKYDQFDADFRVFIGGLLKE
ncbi:TlpA disulfide reductase family protein [Sediminicola arcticus]|jgi:thiol-disulfide isomerase/thioredoxin|uniref:TlpA disulfide reductase family protein n=1 Tax=Sediminicola arcticus TaxID=1574308 RepID=A0ABV2STA0_9FLAO